MSGLRVVALVAMAAAGACRAAPPSGRDPVPGPPPPSERADVVVAADGSGGFRTIQEAIDSFPAGDA